MSSSIPSRTVTSIWAAKGVTQPQVKGIPNFFSKSMFGNTGDLKSAAQFAAVWAVVAVIMRIFSRRRMKTRIWWDDVCAIGAVFFLVTNQTVFSMIEYLGKSTFALVAREGQEEINRLARIVVGLKLSLAFEVIYLISIYLVKFSMLFLYARFARHTKYITVYLRITQGICGITFMLCILSLFLSCTPIKMFWSIFTTNNQCTRRTLLSFTSGISDVITNTLVLAIPVPLLFRANLTFRQKIGVSILYFFGAFVIVASALRFATQLLNVSVRQAIGWSQIEVSLATILACVPMCVKLLLTPLIDPCEIEKTPWSTGFVETPTTPVGQQRLEKSGRISKHVNRLRASAPPASLKQESQAAPTEEPAYLELDDERLAPDRRRKYVSVGAVPTVTTVESYRSPSDVNGPDYHRLKVVSTEVNGQSIWEVRPISPATPIKPSGSEGFPVV